MPELVELIHRRDFNGLREILCAFPAPDIAEIFVDLKPDDEAVLLRLLPRRLAAEVFEYLPLDDQEKMLHALGSEQVAQILNDIAPDDRTALLEELPAAATQKLLSLLDPDERKIATELLGYPKKSVGRRMRPEYVAIQQNWTVAEVFAHLRREERKREVMNQLYVTDSKGRLVDFVPLRNVVVAAPQTSVLELLQNQQIFLRATDDQETAVITFKKYDVTILPVVDSQDVLLGVITVDDVMDVAEREATEDIQKLGGVQALDAPYLNTGIFQMVKKRAPWLAVLFVGEMFTSVAMQNYGGEIQQVVVLAFFVPLILSSGGNSGSQATSLIIRAMAVRDVLLSDWWRVFRRTRARHSRGPCVRWRLRDRGHPARQGHRDQQVVGHSAQRGQVHQELPGERLYLGGRRERRPRRHQGRRPGQRHRHRERLCSHCHQPRRPVPPR